MNEIWPDSEQMSIDKVRLSVLHADTTQVSNAIQQKLANLGRGTRQKFRGLSSASALPEEDLTEVLDSPSYNKAIESKAESIAAQAIDERNSNPENMMFQKIRLVLKNAGVEDENTFAKIVEIGRNHAEQIYEYRSRGKVKNN